MESRTRVDAKLLEVWYQQIHALMVATTSWLQKKKKHEASGVALVTQLQCISLQSPQFSVREFDSWVDKMHKWLKDSLFSDTVRR
jgi:hypothetical protein